RLNDWSLEASAALVLAVLITGFEVLIVSAGPVEEDDECGRGEYQPRGDDGDRAEPERQDVVEQPAHRRGRIRQSGGDEDRHEDRDAGRGELVPEAGAAAGQQAAGLDDPARAQDPKRADEADEPEELNGSERESDAEDDEN